MPDQGQTSFKKLVEEFFEEFFKSRHYRPARAVLTVEQAMDATKYPPFLHPMIPIELYDGEPDESGFVRWKPIDSPISASLIVKMEDFLQTKLPPTFVQYLTYKSTDYLDIYAGHLPPIPPYRPLHWLEWSEKVSSLQPFYGNKPYLIPFVPGIAGAGYLCFDTRRPTGDGEFPVVMVNSCWNNGTSLTDGNEVFWKLKVFDGFNEYLSYLVNFLKYDRSEREVSYLDWLRANNHQADEFYNDALCFLNRNDL